MFAWFELECHTVDAKPLTSRPRSIRKHMAKVSFALFADDLCASWSQRGVHMSQDPCVTLIRARCPVGLRKRRPSSARAILFLRAEERAVTANTVIHS